MKKIIYLFLSLISFSVILPTSTVVAAEHTDSQNKYYEEAYNLALIIENNTNYDEENKEILFDTENAINDGLDEDTAYQIEEHYSLMTPEEAEKTYNEIISSNYSTRSFTGLIAAAAKILAKAGLGWLARKLYDWGAEKFCNAYKDSNSVTENVCNFLGE